MIISHLHIKIAHAQAITSLPPVCTDHLTGTGGIAARVRTKISTIRPPPLPDAAISDERSVRHRFRPKTWQTMQADWTCRCNDDQCAPNLPVDANLISHLLIYCHSPLTGVLSLDIVAKSNPRKTIGSTALDDSAWTSLDEIVRYISPLSRTLNTRVEYTA